MNVHAHISKEWRRRMLIMALMLNGFALWFLYDGYINWPAEAQRFEQLTPIVESMVSSGQELDLKHLDKNPEVVRAWKTYAAQHNLPDKLPKERTDSDLAGQRGIGLVLLGIGLTFVAWVALQHRKSVRAVGDLITGPNGEQVNFSAIVEMDRRKWEKKGIAYAIYEVDGRQKRLCLDDHKFIGCEAIILEAEKRIAARQPTPPETIAEAGAES